MYMNENSFRPTIFNFKKRRDRIDAQKLIRTKKIQFIVDEVGEQKKELGFVHNPRRISHALLFSRPAKEQRASSFGLWIYFPWRAALVHVLELNKHEQVRLSRNFNLILPREQRQLKNLRIAFAGLNVGNPGAICLALEGAAGLLKLADNDVLALSNLNRFRAGLPDLGINKAVLTARQIYEINPFAKLKVFENGVEPGKEEAFLLRPKVDVLVEEMDDMKLKISIREKARKFRIPVVMVTGNGPNVIVDVERFDQNPRLALLNGFLRPQVAGKVVRLQQGTGTFTERMLLARDFMGARYLHSRLRSSFLKVGKTLAGIPQIAESSFLRGAAICYVVRQIASRAKMPSGRYFIHLEDLSN